ncbi:MAG: matrixin family metalloprotease [Christensenellales bacterium]
MKKKNILLKALLSLLMAVLFVFCSAFIAAPGAAAASTKKDIVRVDFIHYAKNSANARVKTDPGYALMKVKWLTSPVSYSLNMASVPIYMDAAAVKQAFGISSEVWDDGTSPELFNLPGETSAHYGVLDGTNAVEFGVYAKSTSVIAVTSVWYNRKTKGIVEFDMLYNTYYTWGDADTAATDVMDLKNIATHELGHAVGLGDVYSSTYSYVTMYGYASFNEVIKRDLADKDLIGLHLLYGE